MSWDPFTKINSLMSVDVNGIKFPARYALDYSVRYSAPLLFQNNSEDYPLSTAGSCFLFRFRKRFFQISTQHQLDNQDRDASEVRITLREHEQTILLSPWKSYSQNKAPVDDPRSDFRLWEYDTSLDARFSKNFLGLREDHFSLIPPEAAKKVIVYYTVAFPSIAQKVDLDETEVRSIRLRTNWATVHLVKDDDALPLIDGHSYMRSPDPFRNMGLSVDGFSGAPVFAIYQTSDLQLHFAFCGLITNGDDDGRVAVLPAHGLLLAIKQTCDDFA